MKTGIATTVSVVGVIVAGVAAFAVNNSVLSASSPSNSVNMSTSIPAGATGNSPINGGKISAAVAKATPITDTTTTYAVGNAGSVVLDTATGAIVVTGIAPAAGYTSEPATTDAQGVVKVRFVSSMQHLEFIAQLVNGQVQVSVKDITPSSVKPAPTKPRHDDDHDDDEDEEDEHHDEDHDEDHEDEDDD